MIVLVKKQSVMCITPNDGVQRSRATSFGRSESVASLEVFGCSMFFVLIRSAR